MELWSLPKARPISCNVCPAFQRRHTSIFCSAESPNRFPRFINTTFETALYQMVLHRPFEPAALIRHVPLAPHFARENFQTATDATAASNHIPAVVKATTIVTK